MKEVSI
jgi:hypothetical protein